MRAILAGKYTKWNQVPEFASLDTTTGTPINLCRRDHGSGTELSADITFTGQACGYDGALPVKSGTVTAYQGATAPWTYEAPATADMLSCVSSADGTIGIRSNAGKDSNFSYVILLVDGYQPNAHNAAAGLYRYAYEDQAGVLANNAGGGNLAASTLVADAKSFSILTSNAFANETVVTSNTGQWLSGAGSVYSVVGKDGLGLAAHRTGVQWVSDKLPESMFTRNGDSCAERVNTNK
jgi:hypothetical protein